MTSHSISAFQFTVRNPAIKGREKQSILNAINVKNRQYDFLDVIQQFLAGHSATYQAFLVNQSNRLVGVVDVQRRANSRDIGFYIAQGTFGTPGEIISSRSLKKTHQKGSDESDVAPYYVHMRVPKGAKVGYAVLHSIGNIGVKSWLHDQLGIYVNNQLSSCVFTLRPLCSKLTLQTYLKDAEINSIRISHYDVNNSGDVANYLLDETVEKTLVLKREGGFGKLLPYMKKSAKRDRLIAITDPECTDVKADVTFNGRNRTISLEGSKVPKAKFYINEPDVEFSDGMPVRKSIAAFATALLDDLVNEAGVGN